MFFSNWNEHKTRNFSFFLSCLGGLIKFHFLLLWNKIKRKTFLWKQQQNQFMAKTKLAVFFQLSILMAFSQNIFYFDFDYPLWTFVFFLMKASRIHQHRLIDYMIDSFVCVCSNCCESDQMFSIKTTTKSRTKL